MYYIISIQYLAYFLTHKKYLPIGFEQSKSLHQHIPLNYYIDVKLISRSEINQNIRQTMYNRKPMNNFVLKRMQRAFVRYNERGGRVSLTVFHQRPMRNSMPCCNMFCYQGNYFYLILYEKLPTINERFPLTNILELV